MKLSSISKIALVVLLGTVVPAQAETQELTPQQKIQNAMIQASIPETYEWIMYLYDNEPVDLRFELGARIVMLQSAQKCDKSLDKKDIDNKIELINTAIAMQMCREHVKRAEEDNTNPDQAKQDLSAIEARLKERAEKFANQAL